VRESLPDPKICNHEKGHKRLENGNSFKPPMGVTKKLKLKIWQHEDSQGRG